MLKDDLDLALEVFEARGKTWPERVQGDRVVKISVVGVGMRSHAGVGMRMFQALAEKGLISVTSTSEIKISVLRQMLTPNWR